MHLRPRYTAAALGLAATMLALTACSGGSSSVPTASAAPSGAVDLKAAGCPSTVVIQTDWVPEAEHGHLYELLGSNYTIDTSKKTVTGPLISGGKSTGVNLQIRAGGPAIGFSNVSTQMAKDSSITMGYIGTDENIEFSNKFHNTAVMAPLEKSPFIIMWDPATYKDATDLKSLNSALTASGGKVIYSAAQAAYMPYLTAHGIISSSNLNGSYTGAPATFVAAKGKDAQQGFASAEPYIYQHLIKSWGKPVKYALIADSGWTPYTSSLSVPTANLKSLSGCLKKLVPVLQQGEKDFFANPEPAISLILKLTAAYKLGFSYDKGTAEYSVATMKADNLVGNGPDGGLGSFDPTVVSNFVKVAVPTFTTSKITTMNASVDPTSLYTNQFIDTSISYK